ncbi:hypothetical protein D8674_026642 [Pyrus ussuriensis x Pyrus communis]|uniref:Uncharacterized protein n=1 Tax=Pyrus ussuriensis x Pyrus communis TaxID=2448454 RepID=A0A5N5I8G6_9ROSA|nr:hypothetical protein D8674_026642 [Pyrus ussuriensis x Pyrus communis]
MDKHQPDYGVEDIECLSDFFEDCLDLENRFEDLIHLVGRMIVDQEPLQYVMKEVRRLLWHKLRVIRVARAKENIHAITNGEEAVARQLLEGNPWFVKGYSFSVKFWPTYHSLDHIKPDKVMFWVQSHGIPR